MPTADQLAPGTLLGERYALKKQEWVSPLGPVWLARDRVLDRAVLVIVLAARLADDQVTRRAFQRAAAGIAQLSHAAVLQVFDIGDDPTFVVVEHGAGGRLEERLRAGPLRAVDAVRASLSIARGMEALHERGTAHGALSPATVLFDAEGRAKILALGAAGPTAEKEQPPGYRPPEPDALPAERDRYALAALTFHMLNGKPPEPGTAPRARRAIPSAIEALLRRALSPDPAARPSLDEFEGALAPFARVEPTEARGSRFSASEFRWLIPALLIIGLAIVATTFGVRFVQDLADDRGETPSPTATTTAPAGPLEIEEAAAFDPLGDGEENDEDAPRAIDGEPETYWGTVGYSNAALGNAKPGVGLLLDLGEVLPVARIRIETGLEGWSGQIRVAEEFSEEPGGYARAARFTANNEVTFTLSPGTRARYVLVWITELAFEGGRFPYGAEISEIELFGV